jgi:hypothetical protein
VTTATQTTNRVAAATIQPDAVPSLIDKILSETSDKMDRTVRAVSAELETTEGHFRRAMVMARGIQLFRTMLDSKMVAELMGLMNNPLGFQTDRGPGKGPGGQNSPEYTAEVVKDCMVAAFLQGAFPVGNEVNILFGQCFLAKAYWKRMVLEIPGLTDLRMVVGIPLVREGKTTVRVACSWKLNGANNQLLDHEGKPGIVFSTITNQRSTDNACQGKAERQAYKRIYELIRGSVRTADADALAEGEIPNEPAAATSAPVTTTKFVEATGATTPQHDGKKVVVEIQRWESRLVALNLCEGEQLIDKFNTYGLRNDLPARIDMWPQEQLAKWKDLALQFKGEFEQHARDREDLHRKQQEAIAAADKNDDPPF